MIIDRRFVILGMSLIIQFRLFFMGCIISGLFLTSCKKTTESFIDNYPPNSFFSLKVGDSAFFRMDSLEFTPGKQDPNKTTSYLVKEEVASIEKDNLDRPMWKINRSINKDTTGNGLWKSDSYYFIQILDQQVDIIENNLRFIRIKAPVRTNFFWKGNSYLPSEAYPEYDFSIDNNMPNWNYLYKNVGSTERIGNNNKPFDQVTTIELIDQSINVSENNNDIIAQNNFASREKWVEQYAQDIGLIYKEQILWEYQPVKQKKIGFLLKMWRVNQ
jgi:hypothetical protein